MIKAIIFDWGVLIDNPSKSLRNFCADYLKVEKSEFDDSYSNYSFMFQKSFISEGELWENVCIDLDISNKISGSLWKKAVVSSFKDKKEIFLILRLLKKKGYKIGFLSNTEIPAMKYFFEKKYDKFFDASVFSCNEKILKPDKEIYLIALKKLGVKPEETLFIDDNPKFVESAINLGIKGRVFKDATQLITDLEKLKINLL